MFNAFGTPMSHYSTKQGSNNDISENEDTQMRAQIDNLEGNLSRNNDVEDTLTPPKCVTSVTTVTDMYVDIKPPPRPSGFTSDTEESKEGVIEQSLNNG